MKVVNVFLFSLAFVMTLANAKLETDYWVRENVMSTFYGCKYAVSFQAMYCEKDTTKSYKCQCKDKVAQSAFVYCGIQETKNKTSDLKNFLNQYNAQCSSYNKSFTLDNLYKIYDNATKYIETPKNYGKFNKTTDVLRTPLKYNTTIFNYGEVSYYRRYQNESRGIIIGITTVVYWVFVFLVGAIYQIAKRLFPKAFNSNSKLQKLKNEVWMKNYKQPLAIFGTQLGYTPNVMESFLIIGSFIILLVGSCWGYRFHQHDVIWKDKAIQISRYVGDRTGYISLFTMNLTFLFAGRNNILLWATGWNFSSFIMYHKFIARITVALIFAHTIAYVVNSVLFDKYATRHVQNYWIWGSVAVTCGVVMVLSGNFAIRKAMYDVFVFLHIILAVFFLIGAWYHLLNFDLQYYCYATIGVWALDRLLRLTRMFVIFGGFRKNKITIFQQPDCESNQVDPNDIFLRIDVDNFNKSLFKIKDGNFAFIYILHPKGFWQSHPFTLVKTSNSEDFAVVLKVKKGLTKHVYDTIVKSRSNSKYFKVCIEGPYGVSKNSTVAQVESMAVITAGTGVSGPLCYLNHHKNSKLNEKASKPNVLHWAVRSLNVVHAYEKELRCLAENGNVDITIYCSKPSYTSSTKISKNSSESELEKKDELAIVDSTAHTIQNVLSIKNLNIVNDYMCVEEVVRNEMESSSSLVIMTCGLPAICDEARYHFLKSLASKKGSYELIDDSQVW